jgi:hypothetical protein
MIVVRLRVVLIHHLHFLFSVDWAGHHSLQVFIHVGPLIAELFRKKKKLLNKEK